MLYAALERLDTLMAIGEKRSVAKAEAKQRGEATFAFTDLRIHSYQTRATYQDVIMRFLNWCRTTCGLNRLEAIDERANELSSRYLTERVRQHYSAWTLRTERSALRVFFQHRDLAAGVELPPRKRAHIMRSRRPAVRDTHLQPSHWQPLITFCQACGLRREELRDVRVRDVYQRRSDSLLVVRVVRGKGGKWREVPVLFGCEQAVLTLVQERHPNEHLFAHVPEHLDIQALRRTYAQLLYQHLSGRPVPGTDDPLEVVDLEAALQVSRALGHNRLDIVLTYYLR